MITLATVEPKFIFAVDENVCHKLLLHMFQHRAATVLWPTIPFVTDCNTDRRAFLSNIGLVKAMETKTRWTAWTPLDIFIFLNAPRFNKKKVPSCPFSVEWGRKGATWDLPVFFLSQLESFNPRNKMTWKCLLCTLQHQIHCIKTIGRLQCALCVCVCARTHGAYWSFQVAVS
jgi:hypothetical protein